MTLPRSVRRPDSVRLSGERAHFDVVVIGGGFYGARLALTARREGARVLLLERESELLTGASYRNQARVHGGYHYPRSVLTSLRCRTNYGRFVAEYAACIDATFDTIYAIARQSSKVTGGQFLEVCHRIGAPITRAPANVSDLFDARRVEAVFVVAECAFDAVRLRQLLTEQLAAAGVHVWLSTTVDRYEPRDDGAAVVHARRDGDQLAFAGNVVLNCTYSRLNDLLVASGQPPVPLKHELTELALVEVPAELAHRGITVMDGPFFSVVPFPSRGLHSLSHVRYTPHYAWDDGTPNGDIDTGKIRGAERRQTRVVHMLRDASRFVPAMGECRYVESLWEVKTVLPRSEADDSRPILLRRCDQRVRCYSVLGAKIDGVYDVEDSLKELAAIGNGRP